MHEKAPTLNTVLLSVFKINFIPVSCCPLHVTFLTNLHYGMNDKGISEIKYFRLNPYLKCDPNNV